MLFSDLLKMKTWFALVIQNNSILKLSWNDLQTSFIPEKLRRSRRISCIPISSTEQITSWICIGVWTWQQKYHNPPSFHQVQAFHSSPGWQRLKEGRSKDNEILKEACMKHKADSNKTARFADSDDGALCMTEVYATMQTVLPHV